MRDRDLSWRPVLVSDNAPIRCSLLEILQRRIAVPEETVISSSADASTILELAQASAANVFLIDMSSDEDQAIALIRELSGSNLTIVALHTADDSSLILRCIRSGAHEFVSDPFDGDSVWQTLDELAGRRLKTGAEPRGSVYTVFPSMTCPANLNRS